MNKTYNKLVSIIIRAFNEEDWIESCINSIHEQTYKNYEIIFVDNYSKDNTIKIVKKYKNIKILRIKDFKPGKAINHGIKKSNGEIIVCLSAHCIPTNKLWLSSLIKPLSKKNIAAVYGRQEPLSFSSPLDKRDLLTVFGLDKKVQSKDPFFHNANSCFLKKTWKKFPFDEKVQNVEDRLWGKVIIDNKLKIYYEPLASVYHWHGINHSQNIKRAESIIKILEQQSNKFFNYKLSQSNHSNKKGVAVIPARAEDIIDEEHLVKTIRTATNIIKIDKVYVITDSKKLSNLITNCGAHAVLRPNSMSNKTIDLFDITRYLLNLKYREISNFSFVMILQIEYPFRDSKLLQKALNFYLNKKCHTLIAARQESRVFEIISNNKSVKSLKSDIFVPQYFKNNDLLIFLTGFFTFCKIDELLDRTWRYKDFSFYKIEESVSLKITKKNYYNPIFKSDNE